MPDSKPIISEIIIVEGRDDTDAVLKAVDASTIETHGFGISGETWKRIETAYQTTGIIIFTDPDRAGENIRKRITEKFPDAKQAYLPRDKAESAGDIGIENAAPEDIIKAINNVRTLGGPGERNNRFTMEDMEAWGLSGGEGAGERRAKLGARLGIGYGNGRAFLKRLNGFGLSREEVEKAYGDLFPGGDKLYKK